MCEPVVECEDIFAEEHTDATRHDTDQEHTEHEHTANDVIVDQQIYTPTQARTRDVRTERVAGRQAGSQPGRHRAGQEG